MKFFWESPSSDSHYFTSCNRGERLIWQLASQLPRKEQTECICWILRSWHLIHSLIYCSFVLCHLYSCLGCMNTCGHSLHSSLHKTEHRHGCQASCHSSSIISSFQFNLQMESNPYQWAHIWRQIWELVECRGRNAIFLVCMPLAIQETPSEAITGPTAS